MSPLRRRDSVVSTSLSEMGEESDLSRRKRNSVADDSMKAFALASLPAALSLLLGTETGTDLACLVLTVVISFLVVTRLERYYASTVDVYQRSARNIELANAARGHLRWALVLSFIVPCALAGVVVLLKRLSDGAFMQVFHVEFFLIASLVRPCLRMLRFWRNEVRLPAAHLQRALTRVFLLQITTAATVACESEALAEQRQDIHDLQRELSVVRGQVQDLARHVDDSVHRLVASVRHLREQERARSALETEAATSTAPSLKQKDASLCTESLTFDVRFVLSFSLLTIINYVCVCVCVLMFIVFCSFLPRCAVPAALCG